MKTTIGFIVVIFGVVLGFSIAIFIMNMNKYSKINNTIDRIIIKVDKMILEETVKKDSCIVS